MELSCKAPCTYQFTADSNRLSLSYCPSSDLIFVVSCKMIARRQMRTKHLSAVTFVIIVIPMPDGSRDCDCVHQLRRQYLTPSSVVTSQSLWLWRYYWAMHKQWFAKNQFSIICSSKCLPRVLNLAKIHLAAHEFNFALAKETVFDSLHIKLLVNKAWG